MAKRKVARQTMQDNRSGVRNDAWGRKTLLTRVKAQIGSGAKSQQVKELVKQLEGKGFKSIVNSKKSAANAAAMAVKGNQAYIIYKPNNKNVSVYGFNAKDAKMLEGIQHQVLLAASSRQKPRLVPGNNQSLSRFQSTLNAFGLANVGGTRGGMGREKQMKQNGIKFQGDATKLLAKQGIDISQIQQIKEKTYKPKTPQTFNTPVVTPIAGQERMSKETFKSVDTANINEEQWNQMTKTQKFLTIAKMSSPNFKADKANAFAKQKELKAKNTARMIGVAGKAVSQIGYGISKGYQKGWNQR